MVQMDAEKRTHYSREQLLKMKVAELRTISGIGDRRKLPHILAILPRQEDERKLGREEFGEQYAELLESFTEDPDFDGAIHLLNK